MDNLTWSSGVDRGEMLPPIPARRTKRKMTTTEDSKPLNTGVSEQTIFIMPPPRRKHKPKPFEPNPIGSSQQRENVFPKEVKEDNRVTLVLKSESASVDRRRPSIPTLTAYAGLDPIGTPRPPTKELTDHKECSELKTLNFKSNLERLDVDETADNLESNDERSLDLTLNHKSYVESNIFEMFIDNRVLDMPLVADSHEPSDEELEVNKQGDSVIKMSIPENSATIVGVFYKSEYSSLNKVNKIKTDFQPPNLDVDTRFWQSSTINNSEKATLAVLEDESKNIETKILIKETEENDSGVYFSDTRYPPFRESYLDHQDPATKEENNLGLVDLSNYSSSHYPFTCNDRDTLDNKNMEDFGSKSYKTVLDDFEGQTVKALREEVTSLFSVCNGELSKTQVVKDWLDNGKYSFEKKGFSNRNFSEYLKTMLTTESERDSLSPYPLSTVEEDDRSDVLLEDVQESRLKEGFVEHDLPGASFTNPTSSLDHVESSVSSSNNNRPIDVIVDNVNVYYVNTNCKVASEKNKNVDSAVENTLSLSVKKQNHQEVHADSGQLTFQANNNPVTPFKNTSAACNHNFDLTINKPPTPSLAIKHGAVTSLIAYFESIKNNEFEPLSCDKSLSEKSDESVHESEEDAESDAIPTEDFFGSFENKEQISRYQNETTEDIFEVDHNTNEVDCSSVVLMNCENHAFPDFQSPTKIEALQEDESKHFCSLEKEPQMEHFQSTLNSELQQTSTGYLTKKVIKINILKENCDVQIFKNEENINEEKCEEIKRQLPEHSTNNIFNDKFCSNELSNNDEEQFDDSSIVDLMDNDYLTNVKAMVPIDCKVTKEEEIVNNRVPLPLFKPAMIPIVVLTEADFETSQIGSIELHPSLQPAMDITELSPEISEASTTKNLLAQSNQNFDENEESFAKSETDQADIEVVLEKNWGSIGLKLQGGEGGVFVSDILAGGSADESGVIFKGWINMKKMAGQEEIFC